MGVAQEENQSTREIKVKKKGGLKTMPFIIANETFEKAAGVGLFVNMILYLQNEYHLSVATATEILFIWGAISYFLPTLGAFISDSYLGRFRVISLGTFASLLGIFVLWLTTIIPDARPTPCAHEAHNCVQPNARQLMLLFTAFALMSIGAGGIRPCSIAFGADQFHNPNNPNNEKVLQTYFNWYYAAVGFSILFSVTVIVTIQDKAGWKIGFGVPVVFMLVSSLMFLAGSSLYVKVKADTTLFTSLAQASVAAWKNRHLELPPRESNSNWYHLKGSKMLVPTRKLRFLNKACLIRNPDKDLDMEGLAIDPWNLCTVRQVEELKVLMKVLPIWSTGIMLAVTLSQHTFPVLQAGTMDRRLAGNFKIQPGSFFAFAILTLTIWVVIYDRILVPFISKYTKRPRGLTIKQRMGIGLVISCIATAVAGLVEHKRRATAFREGFADDSSAVIGMSAMWLVPQQCLVGLAEGFNAIGQIDFYYSQFPKTMASIGVALFSLGFAVGNLVGSFIVLVLNWATDGNGKVKWLANNLNKGHYDYYYWVLSGLSVINFFYFLLCARSYGSEDNKVWDEIEDTAEDKAKHQDGTSLPAAV